MELLFLIFILATLIAGIVGIFWFLKGQEAKEEGEKTGLSLIQGQMNEMARRLDFQLGKSNEAMQKQFNDSTRIIKEITQELTRVEEGQKQVMDIGKQLRSLEDILKNPKQRGIYGEFYLETLLKNVFQPKQYQMQYKFKDGEIVDAVIFFGDKIIPIDSKFSLENYNRIVEETDPTRREELENVFKQDLKKRIDETAKYIRPQEGTTEFAFMFIPAEGIYYDLLVNRVGAVKVNTRDLIEYASREKKVYIVSPTTFYVTLQSISHKMRDDQIQESAKEILKNVGELGKHLKTYEDYHNKLGIHLGTTVNTYNNASKEFRKIDKDILKLTGGKTDIEPMILEKPKEEE